MDAASIKDLIEAVKTLGFPVVMCLWFMWRDIKRDKEHTAALNAVSAALKEMGATVSSGFIKVGEAVEEIQDGLESTPHNVVGMLPLPPPKEGSGK